MAESEWIGELVVFTWTRPSGGVEPEDMGLVTEELVEVLRDGLGGAITVPRLRVWWPESGLWSAHPAYQLKLVEE